MTYASLLGKCLLEAELVCRTGLHIGGTTTGIEIGGMDNPVIKDPISGLPYIPGSSLRGKLRSLLEWSKGLIKPHYKHKGPGGRDNYAAYDCEELKTGRDEATDRDRWDRAFEIARLFGAASDESPVRQQAGPSRLLVRDAFPSKGTIDGWAATLGENIYTEVKTENALDRLTAEANPRPMERVPADSKFDCSLIVDIYGEGDAVLLRDLFSGLLLLEHSALGGAGSRGSGRVEFRIKSLSWRPVAYYRSGQGAAEISLPPQVDAALKKLHDEDPLTALLRRPSR